MPDRSSSRWVHVTAWVLACATFPLIWVGGLVTTYRAGMAVPDWPNTYGYNLFLYPLSSWLAVWGLFLEHSHRLIGATVGLITILLAGLVWWQDGRRWMRRLAVIAIAGVSFQGVLGGFRVTENAMLLAMVHGCTAPLFFCLCAAMVVFTAPAWRAPEPPGGHAAARTVQRLALAVACGLYVQIVLGALVRHRLVSGGLAWFPVWVWLHLIVAGLLLAGIAWLWVDARRRVGDRPRLVRRSRLLAVLFVLQALLGAGTWVTNFGFPGWFQDYVWPIGYTVVQEGRLQAWVTTAHVAFGSLNLIAALTLVLWSRRLLAAAPRASSSRSSRMVGR